MIRIECRILSIYIMIMENNQLTAKSWILMDNQTKKYLRGYNTLQKYQIASLTKMYTLFACLELNELLNIKPQLCKVEIVMSTTIGTLANLEVGKCLKVQDLYYGLMLPSGNDAALILAYYYGYWLGKSDKIPNFQWKNEKSYSLEGKKKYNKIYLSRFMAYLNNHIVRERFNHQDTHFQNPHGLPDKFQRSTAWQIGIATMKFLCNKEKFVQITKTKKYLTCYDDGTQVQWENTNILLRDGYIGIKTGHTATAGNCLSSRKIIEVNGIRYDLVLIILGCKTLEKRFTETVILMDDFHRYLKEMS